MNAIEQFGRNTSPRDRFVMHHHLVVLVHAAEAHMLH